MKKPVASSSSAVEGKPVHTAALDSPAFRLFPCLMKHVAVTRYDDGTPRVGGTLILRAEGANWKLIIKDATTALMMVLAASTIDDVLALGELLLGAEQAPWEQDPNAWTGPAKKKK